MIGTQAMLTRFVHGWGHVARRAFGGNYLRIEPPTGPAPEELEADAHGLRLSFLRWRGQGATREPTLLLLHGLNNNAWSWARVANLLGEGRDVVAVSMRGHGRSDAPANGYTLAETTADLAAFLDALGLDAVDLAGHSWGGKVALHFAATHPGRVRTLTLADPVPPRGLNPLLTTFPILVEAALAPERGPFADRAAMDRGSRELPYLWAWDPTDRRVWHDSFREQPDGGFRHSLPDSGYREIVDRTFREDLTPRLPDVRCPVLLLRPTFSVAFWPGEYDGARRAWPALCETSVPGDHAFVHTNPIDTAAAMRKFLTRNSPD